MKTFRKTFKQIRRTPYQALSAIAVLTVTFFVANIFALVALGSQAILRHFETRPQVIAYLRDEVQESQTTGLVNELNATGVVEDIKYISKNEAYEIYKESVGNDPLLLGTVTDLSLITAEILPSSVEISVTDPNDFPAIISILQNSELVDTNIRGEKDIDFPQDVITELTAWTRGIRLGGIILIASLAFSSVLTTMIIISLKIGHRRAEIGTMKLLGANRSFIANPYIMESTIYSLIGGVFGWLFSYISLLYASPFLAPRLSGIIDMPPSPLFMIQILGGSILAAVILGLFAGSLAVGRFLKR